MSQVDSSIVTSALASKAAPKAAKGKAVTPARSQQQAREIVTFETARRICPSEGVAAKISTVYGIEPVDYHAIREATEEHVARSAQALASSLNEKALEMHLQRIVDGFVRSAYGAGNFYDKKAALARELSSAIANPDRDEDRPGVDGLANRAERACGFAAIVGMQAYALLAAAEGAVDAYAQVCGQDWKPYDGAPGAALSRQTLAHQVNAFTG